MKEKYGEIVRYLIVGVLTTIVSLGAYYGCVFTFLNPKSALQLQLANVLSWIVAVTFAYVMSRIYVFQSKRKNVLQEIVSFYSSRLLTLFMDMAIMFVMVTLLGINDKIAKLVVQMVVTVANYVFSKIFVFRGE
ncbi:GtrA family protein [Clostridium sp. AM42-4]|uniref:GtrA family protein n=1 Tax=Clostridium sp. AM42-4 TaxID=2292305 RepID=UPI000E51AF79|nr:GtrA family protein [Clostridium sp. AM42-4]RHS91022.1 GtrA family protein [Clostridium sp. AM42-4]